MGDLSWDQFCRARLAEEAKACVPEHCSPEGSTYEEELAWAQSAFRQQRMDYWSSMRDASTDGFADVVFSPWPVLPELVLAFGGRPLIPEMLIRLDFFDAAHRKGFPVDACGTVTGVLGAACDSVLPPLACSLASTFPCDSTRVSYQALEYMTQAPTFFLDVPYWNNERVLAYLTEQFQEAVSFLEKHLHRRLDPERLRATLDAFNQTTSLMQEVNEMYRAKPCPGTSRITQSAFSSRLLGRSVSTGKEYARRIHELTRKHLERGVNPACDEKIRVIWFDMPIMWAPIVQWMEETFGAVVPCDMWSYVNSPCQIDTSSETTMLTGLAAAVRNNTMTKHLVGPIDYYVRDAIRLYEEYQGDCFVFATNVPCKQTMAMMSVVRQKLEAMGAPVLAMESDMWTPRLANEQQIKNRIENFFATNGLI